MANAPDPVEVPAVKVARLQTDFSLCLVCQKKTVETHVAKPTAHDQLLTCVRDRSTYGDGAYPEINRRLGPEELAASGASWLQKCYQETVACHVTDTTNIAKVEMKRLLSHTKTKSELTAYLAE